MRFEICNFLFEYYFGRVCSEESEGFPFNEAFFNSLRVTGSKMGILKCLSWFEMSTHIKDCVSFQSFPFADVGVQECCFLIRNFSCKFDRRVMIVCLFNEMLYSVSVCSPEWDVVYETFPNERFKKLWLRISVSTLFMNMLEKVTAIFVPMAEPCAWR